MPSDLAKKKAAKKKEAAKARQRPKKNEELNGEGEKPESQENGVSEFNGESEALVSHTWHADPWAPVMPISIVTIIIIVHTWTLCHHLWKEGGSCPAFEPEITGY